MYANGCLGIKIPHCPKTRGALLVKDKMIISDGYNGTPWI